MEKNNRKYTGPFFGDLYRNYEKRGKEFANYLEVYCDDMEFIAETMNIGEKCDDIPELMKMSDSEVHAFFGLVANMNFLENKGHIPGNKYYPDTVEWFKINNYWVENYPSAYALLEVWVWG